MHAARSLSALAILGLLILGVAPPALASDGVLEINQTCAVETGCFPADTPGFPVEIQSFAGATHFRLTSDLVLSDPALPGIRILTHGISVDLGGFAIMGAACVGLGVDAACDPGVFGSGHGVESARLSPFFEFWRGTTVRNGRILGMRGAGVFVGPESRIDRLEVRWNSTGGVTALGPAQITDVIAVENGFDGFDVGRGSIASRLQSIDNAGDGFDGEDDVSLDGLVATGNTGRGVLVADGAVLRNVVVAGSGRSGIECGDGCSVESSSARGSSETGIVAGDFSTVRSSIAASNGDDGIASGNACTLVDNTVFQNGDAAGDDGIVCLNGCNVRGNTSRSNFENGLQLGAETGYRENVLSNNTSTAVVGGVNLGENLCDGTLCP